MEDWGKVLTFGACPQLENCVIRPSAYGLIEDNRGRLAIIRTVQGTFLPGGGIEPGETPEEAVMREALEECGLVVRPGAWTVRAVQFVCSESETTRFEKRSTFIEAAVDRCGSTGIEADHELVWVDP